MKKSTVFTVLLLGVMALCVTSSFAQEKIAGPWLWMIAPTQIDQLGSDSINVDSLAVASGGAVTETSVAANGANVGDTVGNYTWTLAKILGGDNITNVVNRIGWAEGNVDWHSSYALITLESRTVQNNVLMKVGSDDAIKVWLNGKVVHNNPVDRGSSDFQDEFRINLKQGDNLLLVKVSEGWGDWNMFVGVEANVNAVYKSPLAPFNETVIGLEATFTDHTGYVRALAFSPNGRILASGGADRTINLWDPNTEQKLRTLGGHERPVTSVAFSPNGRLLASSSVDGTVRFWQPGTGRLLRTITGAHPEGVQSVAFSPDGRLLASGGRDNTVCLWDPQTGNLVRRLSRHTDWVLGVAFSPDGLLASASRDRTIRLWNTGGRHLRALRGHTDYVTSIAFAPTGELVSGSRDTTVRLWDPGLWDDVAVDDEARIFRAHTGYVNQVAVSTDGTIASAGADSMVLLWNSHTGRTAVLDAGPIIARSVAFSSDNQMLVSGDEAGVITVLSGGGMTDEIIADDANGMMDDGMTDDYRPWYGPDDFPDIRVYYAIKAEIARARGQTSVDVDTVITDREMSALTSLTIFSEDIHEFGREHISSYDRFAPLDLTGLEFAVNLKELDLSDNLILDVSPLVHLNHLTSLRLENSEIGTLDEIWIPEHPGISDVSPLSGLQNLEKLYLSSNRISDLSPLSALQNLRVLHLNGNYISDVSPLSTLQNLEELYIVYNGDISDVSPLSALQNLEKLHLVNNDISDVSPLSALQNLTELSLGRNQISDVSPLALLTNLETLGLRKNEISDLSPLVSLQNLTKLTLGYNQISQISDLSALTTLQKLHLGNNNISDASPLSNLENLTVLYLGNNKVSDVSVLRSLRSLTKLHLTGNQISDVSPLSGLRNLRELHLDHNRISNFRPINRLVNNLTIYVNSPQLESLIPHSVAVSGPETVRSLIKKYPFTVTVKNASDQRLADVGVEVDVVRKDTNHVYHTFRGARTNGAGEAKFRPNFPWVGPYDFRITVQDEETGTELERTFSNRITVPEPAAIELIKDIRSVAIGSSYYALFAVRDANGFPLEGFDVKLSLGPWEFIKVDSGVSSFDIVIVEDVGPRPDDAPGNWQRFVRSLLDFIPFDQFEAARGIHGGPFEIRKWVAKSNLSDALNTDVTDGEGRARCGQRLSTAGSYAVSATVSAGGRQFLTESFSDLGSHSLGTEFLIYRPNNEFGYLYERVTIRNGWQLWTGKSPDSNPPPYRVQAVPGGVCDAPSPSKEVVEAARQLIPQRTSPDVPFAPLTSQPSTSKKELFPDETPWDSTSCMDPSIRWHPRATFTTDVGVTIITVKFLDGNPDNRKLAKEAIQQWNNVQSAVRLLFVDSGFADVRITFDKNKLAESGEGKIGHLDKSTNPDAIGRAQRGGVTNWLFALRKHTPGFWDKFADTFFDWAGYQTEYEAAVEEAKEQQELPNVWIDPTHDNMSFTAVHEIGHVLGFIHVDGVRDGVGVEDNKGDFTPVETAYRDESSIMFKNDKGQKDLSPGDEKALRNVYGEMPDWRLSYLTGTMSVEGNDDEFWWPDEKFEEDPYDIGIYVGGVGSGGDPAPLGHFKWGGELRLEVDMTTTGRGTRDSVEMKVILRLYEGTTEETDNEVAEKEYTFWVDRNQGGHDYRTTDYFTASASLFHTRTYAKEVTKSRASIQGPGNNWGSVTFDLAVVDINDPPVINEDLVLSAPVLLRPMSPTADLLSASDINGDGQIDTQDLMLVSNAIGQTHLVNPHFDVNSDGGITIVDLVQVAQYLGQSVDTAAPVHIVVPAELTYETVEGWINEARLVNDGSLAFEQGIAKLEYLLTLIIPEKTALLHNYPNPFNPETWIPYHLAKPADVTLTIYAIDGKVVRRLGLGHQAAGFYQSKSRAAHWDGRNNVGERVASGIYFYTLRAGDFAATKKMLILK